MDRYFFLTKIFFFFILVILLNLYLFPFLINSFHPDDLIQINFLQDRGLLKTLIFNINNTSIGRPSGLIFLHIIFFLGLNLKINPWFILIIYKYVVIIFTIFSIGLFLKMFFNKLETLSISILSLILFNIFLSSVGVINFYEINAVDLSLQFSPFIFLVFLIYFCIKIEINNPKNKFFFYLFFILSLNSNYVNIILSSLVVFSKFFYTNNFKDLFKKSFFYFSIILVAISLIIQRFSNSFYIREKIWMLDRSYLESLNEILSISFFKYFFYYTLGLEYLFITIICFVLGLIYKKITFNYSSIFYFILIFLAPINIYVTNFLLNLTSSLEVDPQIFIHWKKNYYSDSMFDELNLQWKIFSATRHVVHFNLFAIISYSTLGFWLSKTFKLLYDKR
jgi:hypothetical protein